ncbi:MAG: DUF4386 family protein [Notoacmeibacter sp.]
MNTYTQKAGKLSAALLILEPALFFVALALLSAAINWPASLGLPYNEVLPLIAENLSQVRAGYGFYLASSLLTIPLGVALLMRLGRDPSVSLWLAAAFMAAAAIFKALGIARWLIAMPALAGLLAADPTKAPAIEAAFTALNEYGGGTLGELLGVGLMTGLWALMLAIFLAGKMRLAALFLTIGAVASFLLVPNEFYQFTSTAVLQIIGRTAIMLGQVLLAIAIIRQKI